MNTGEHRWLREAKRLVLICVHTWFLILLSGCTMHLRAVAKPIEPGVVPTVQVAGPLGIEAGAVDDAEHRFPVSPTDVELSYRDYTDATVRLMQRALSEQSVALGPGGKTLTISVLYIAVM